MCNADERKINEGILRKFDSEALQRRDGTIKDEELADKLAAKKDAVAYLAEDAASSKDRYKKPKDIHTELLVSEDGELNF